MSMKLGLELEPHTVNTGDNSYTVSTVVNLHLTKPFDQYCLINANHMSGTCLYVDNK